MNRLAAVALLSLLGDISFPAMAFESDRISDEAKSNERHACGLLSLTVCLQSLGSEIDLKDVDASLGPAVDKSHSFAQLAAAALAFGHESYGVGGATGRKLPTPCIAQVRYGPFSRPTEETRVSHFVVVLRSSSDGLIVADPPFPISRISHESFDEMFVGNALAVLPSGKSAASSALKFGFTSFLASYGLWAGVLLLLLLILAFTSVRMSLLAACIAGVAATCMFVAGYASPKGTPGDLVAPSATDFGVLSVGQHQLRVPLENRSSHAIEIAGVQSSCGCSIANAPKAIPPRSSRDLTIQVNVREGRGNSVISVATTGGQRRSTTIQWFGRTAPRASPPRLFGLIAEQGESRYSRSVKLWYPHGGDLEVGSLSSKSGFANIIDSGVIAAPNDQSGAGLICRKLEVSYLVPSGENSVDDLLFVEFTVDGTTKVLEIPVSLVRRSKLQ